MATANQSASAQPLDNGMVRITARGQSVDIFVEEVLHLMTSLSLAQIRAQQIQRKLQQQGKSPPQVR
jgi:hypothetical protein